MNQSLQRILEPEVMDTWEESIAYDAMDFTEVNTAFADRAVALGPIAGTVLDLGTGPARIPILMAQRRSQWQIVGIDLSENMLKLGERHLQEAGLSDRIRLERVDAKQMPYADAAFDFVVSNSIMHHLPDPLPCWREIGRILKPDGGLFVRDLLRPEDGETLDRLVSAIGADFDAHQTQLFRDSLHAAFTLEEVEQMVAAARLENVRVYRSSDRHWTAERASIARG
jgi:ubiquinone/menaquinone biosynthesis C-methylase UbiE